MTLIVEVGRLVFARLPDLVVRGEGLVLLGIVLLLVYGQYRRVAVLESDLYGVILNQPGGQLLQALVYGVLGGVVGSFLVALVGVGLPVVPGAVPTLYLLWPLALALGLISPRLICFSYAASLLALGYLIIGWPRVDVPSLTGLVAVLHLVEAFLVWASGGSTRTPLAISSEAGQTLPGFSMQRFWPVPMLILLAVPVAGQPAGGLAMPDWWPLVRPDPALIPDLDSLTFGLVPAVIAMGYADVAVADPVAVRVRRSALNLTIYSLILLGLSILSSRWPTFLWAAAVFSAAGHEWLAVYSSRGQLAGPPWLERPSRGVGLHDVVPHSPADRAGMQVGTVILAVDDLEVNSRADLHAALQHSQANLRIVFKNGLELEHRRMARPVEGLAGLGAICLPEPGDAGQVTVGQRSLFGWLARRWRGGR